MDLQTRCDEAFRDYMIAVQDAWAPAEIQEHGAEAYGRYVKALEEALGPDVQQRVAQQWREYERVVQSPFSSGDMRDRATDAFRNYLLAMRNAWAETAPDGVDAATLTAVCRNMATVAWIAGAATSSQPTVAPDF